jgi:hypothetical protein
MALTAVLTLPLHLSAFYHTTMINMMCSYKQGSSEDRAAIVEYEMKFAADRMASKSSKAKKAAGSSSSSSSSSNSTTDCRANALCKPVVIVTTPEMVIRDDCLKVLAPLRFEVSTAAVLLRAVSTAFVSAYRIGACVA